ncbi:hypothetical protein J6590_054713 [Homalodisca vitripennis]|nr:hypothetical protein J6590_054713 [Homalodisca vitripennis]
MPTKYPCGSCEIGVKYSGLKCTGPCNMWYHAGCQNVKEKTLKKLRGSDYDKNLVRNTIDNPSSFDLTSNTHNQKDILNNSIKTLESSILENEDDKLAMAATIGSALLEENKFLKEQLTIVENKLACLQCKLASNEAKIEEMAEEEEKFLGKIETLSQKLAEAEVQIEKEKKNVMEIQNLSEDHDRKQEQIIEKYVIKSRDLEKQLLVLNAGVAKQQLKTSSKTDTVTQTEKCEFFTQDKPQNLTAILLEISQIKSRQNTMETTLKDLSVKPQCHCSSSQQKLVVYEHSTQTENIPLKNTTRCYLSTTNTHVNIRRPKDVKTNWGKHRDQISVSLQSAKFKAFQNKNYPLPKEQPQAENKKDNSLCNQKSNAVDLTKTYTNDELRLSLESKNLPNSTEINTASTLEAPALAPPSSMRRPPITATRLEPSETFLEFYEKNIEHVKANYHRNQLAPIKMNISPFLEPGSNVRPPI